MELRIRWSNQNWEELLPEDLQAAIKSTITPALFEFGISGEQVGEVVEIELGGDDPHITVEANSLLTLAPNFYEVDEDGSLVFESVALDLTEVMKALSNETDEVEAVYGDGEDEDL